MVNYGLDKYLNYIKNNIYNKLFSSYIINELQPIKI